VAANLRRAAGPSQSDAGGTVKVLLRNIHFANNLSLGYNCCMTDVSKAASLMGRKSAEARAKKWGKKEFVRRMQEWGKLGGRPKGSGKTKGGAK
jgi:hypothetical protein